MNDKENWRDLCKSHSARSVKEFCRVCPSKLNKKELEDVYFTLLEDNLHLKTTINSQSEKIKVLSTKIQRLTAIQKSYLGKEPKDCCGSKAVIEEQKDCIAELRRSNLYLSERVRQLNTRLCSTKQFLKRSPFQSTSRCNRCSNKHASMSALVSKRSDSNLRTAVASSQYLDKDITSSRTVDNDAISHEKGVQYDFCVENKCRNEIEELKEKNENIQEELLRTNKEHSTRVSELEQLLTELRAESVRVRSERARALENTQRAREETAELARKLAVAENRCDDLSLELSMERRKVAELELRVRAAELSRRVAGAAGALAAGTLAVPESPYKPKPAVRTKLPVNPQPEEPFKHSDDSGYTEVNKSQELEDYKAPTNINQMLLGKIADLQNQINKMKPVNNVFYNPENDVKSRSQLIFQTPIEKQQSEDIMVSESSESVITEKKFNEERDVGSKTQENQSISPKKMSSNIKEDPIVTQQQNVNVETKRRESFKRLRRRSKDKSHINKSRDSQIYDNISRSLDSPKNSLANRSLIKTGSLDQNGSVNLDRMDEYESNTNKLVEQRVTQNVSGLDNVVKHGKNNLEQGIPDSVREKNEDKPNVVENQIIDTTNAPSASKINQNTSDSSNGTYSVHKDEKRNGSDSRLATNLHSIETKRINRHTQDTKSKRNHLTKDTEREKIREKISTLPDNISLHVADVKNVLNNASLSKFSYDGRTLPISRSRTYVKTRREVSPNSTECEISSLSDLPSEKYERDSYTYRSPGEERPAGAGDSRDVTTDYGSLSEGELPCVADEEVLSAGEQQVPGRTVKSHSIPSTKQMQAELAAVQQELQRCASLLDGQLLMRDHGWAK